MKFIRGTTKLFGFGIIISIYFLITYIVRFFVRSQSKRRSFYAQFVSRVCRFGLWYLNTEVRIKNAPPEDKNFLYVCNHLGILDVIILSAVRPSLFITSVEMQQTPFLGPICEMAGCLFVERRSRANIHGEIGQIREALQQGHSIGLYPEGTSTNGEKVLPFKKSLLTSAAGTGVSILPLVINYTEINGEPVNTKNRDFVFWYGDLSFPSTLWSLLTNTSVVVELEFFSPIVVSSEEQRREVAEQAYKAISTHFIPII